MTMTKQEAIAQVSPFVILGGYHRATVCYSQTIEDVIKAIIGEKDCGEALIAYGMQVDEDGHTVNEDEAVRALKDARDLQALDGDLQEFLTHEDAERFEWDGEKLTCSIRKNGGYNTVEIKI